MSKTHKDVEFHVDYPEAVRRAHGPQTKVMKSWDEACAFAVGVAISEGPVNLDVIIYSEAGARWWDGDYGLDRYDDDPDASIFQRFVIRADDKGMIA